MLGTGNAWIAAAPKNTLLLAFADGRIASYRLYHGHLEYRSNADVEWVRLSSRQVLQHFAIGTVVGEWLNKYLAVRVNRPRRRTG
jgi:hypothetical protein